jgi:predicted dehydrogenase
VTIPVRIAVAGAGLIGKRHIEEVDASGSAELAAIVDPGPAGLGLANKHGVAPYRSLAELFRCDQPDGVILATPNQMHVDGGLECVAAGVAVIVENPSETPSRGRHQAGRGRRACGCAGADRPSPQLQPPVAREPGGGPILLNLIHEVNNLQSLVPSWYEPFEVSTESLDRSDPLANQVARFLAVIRGEAQPICSDRDGLKTLCVVDAVVASARAGQPVDLVD